MAKKKGKQTTVEDVGDGVSSESASQSSSNGSSKNSVSRRSANGAPDTAPALIICRNKSVPPIAIFLGLAHATENMRDQRSVRCASMNDDTLPWITAR
ncbi:hypothetical protein Landi51_05498 [Colletotrichum acutatum]